jgi:hypothetical protein
VGLLKHICETLCESCIIFVVFVAMPNSLLFLFGFLAFGRVAFGGPREILESTAPDSNARDSLGDLARALSSFTTAPRSMRIDHQENAIDTTLRDKKRKAMIAELFSESSSDSEASSSRGRRKGRGMQEGSRRSKALQRELNFKNEWQRKHLSTLLSPEDLATEVTKMRMNGIKPASASRFAMGIVQEKDNPEYEARYRDKMTILENRIMYHRKDLKRKYSSSTLDPIQMEKVALKKALNPSYASKKLRVVQVPKLSPSKLLKAEKSAQKGAALLDAFQEHLNSKELHLSNAPLHVLEEESRMLPMSSEIQRRDLFYYLKKYLKEHRKASVAELKKLTKDRSAFLGRKNDDNYKARKKQKGVESQFGGAERTSDTL